MVFDIKKVILCLVLALTLFASTALAVDIPGDVEDEELISALNVLMPLDIVKGYPDGSFKPENPVSRAEFATMVVRTTANENLADMMKEPEGPFLDVPKEHWASGYIKIAKDLGVINGVGGGLFLPDATLRPIDAVKMAVGILGYGPVAESKGGYPDGYLTMASKLGLLKNVDISYEEDATRSFCAKLLYNALYVDLCELQPNGDYEIQTDKTLHSEKLDMLDVKEQKGIVTANSCSSFYDTDYEDEGGIQINQKRYRAGRMDVDKYLGYSVTYYVDKGVLYSIVKDDSLNKEVVLSYDEEPQYTESYVYYTDLRTAKEKKLKLSENLIVMNNFERLYAPTAEDFNINCGNVKLLDNDGDNDYDVIFINEYETFMVDSADEKTGTINLKMFSEKGKSRLNGKASITEEDFDIHIEDVDGNEIRIGDLTHNQLLCVYYNEGKNYIRCIAVNDIVEGKITEINSEEGYVFIGDKEYKWAKDILDIEIGDEGKFWLDADKRVSAKSTSMDNDYKETVNGNSYGYVLARKDTSGIDVNYDVKMLVQQKDGTISEKVFALKSKVKLNGNMVEADVAYSYIGAGVPIVYETNSKEEITVINTLEKADDSEHRYYNQAKGTFDDVWTIDDNSVVFVISVEDDYTEYNKDYRKLKSGTYYVDMYKPALGDEYVERLYVIHSLFDDYSSNTLPTGDNIALITGISQSMNKEEDTVDLVKAYMNGVEKSFEIKDTDKAYSEISTCKAGDLVLIHADSNGRIFSVRKILTQQPTGYFRKGVGGEREQTYGIPQSVKSNSDFTSEVISIDYGRSTVAYDIAGVPVYRISSKEIEKINPDSITTAEYGKNVDDVYVLTVNFKPAVVLVW